MSAHGDPNSQGNQDVRFETSDVSSKPVVLSVLALAVFTLVFTFVAHLAFHGLAAREKAGSPEASPMARKAKPEPWSLSDFGHAAQRAASADSKLVPEPRLQLDPKMDLTMLRAAEAKTLASLAWVDKDKGVVQVPIERAMQMLLAKGLPARQGAVPFKMQPHTGFAPDQMAEGAGAPDWQAEPEGGEAEHAGHAAGASHEAASEAHGH